MATTFEPDRHDYRLRLEGHLDRRWASWFGALSMTHEDDGDTWMTCRVADQAALHGVLRKVRDLGVPLVAVQRIERH